jgi:hypothetical protein
MKIFKNIFKIEVWRGLKSKKIVVWKRFGRSWRVLERLGELWPILGGEVGAKMGAT